MIYFGEKMRSAWTTTTTMPGRQHAFCVYVCRGTHLDLVVVLLDEGAQRDAEAVPRVVALVPGHGEDAPVAVIGVDLCVGLYRGLGQAGGLRTSLHNDLSYCMCTPPQNAAPIDPADRGTHLFSSAARVPHGCALLLPPRPAPAPAPAVAAAAFHCQPQVRAPAPAATPACGLGDRGAFEPLPVVGALGIARH